jgi:hypothetical protein
MSINGAITPTGSYLTDGLEGFRIKVIDCHVKPLRSAAPYAALASGYLKLRGRTRPAQWMRPVNDGTGGSTGNLRQRNTDGRTGMLPAWTDIDVLEDEFDDANVKSLPVVLLEVWNPKHDCDSPPDRSCGPVGLVLRELGDSRFQHLGVFTFKLWFTVSDDGEESEDQTVQTWHDQQHWFDTCEK